jgi:hypothetical protein
MKTIKKINDAKLKSEKNNKARSNAANTGKKAVRGCPELNFMNEK